MDNRLHENLTGKNENYIYPFFWMHGEEENLIIDEIHKVYDSGIRGLCLESRIHEDFCGEGWWYDVGIVLSECEKLGMKVWILDDKHFPTGSANDAFLNENKSLRSWGITEYHVDVKGPISDGSVMASCWKKNSDDEIIGIFACKREKNGQMLSGEVIDITLGQYQDMVYFNLPDGAWRIVFLVKTYSGISEDYRAYGDKLNPVATDVFINAVYEPHFEHFSKYFGTTLCGFFSDEAGFYNNSVSEYMTPIGKMFAHYPWADYMRDKFKVSELVGLWFRFTDGKEKKIRTEYMKEIADSFKENFSGKLAGWCSKHGVLYTGHVVEDNHIHAMTGAGAAHFLRQKKNRILRV